MFEPRPQDYHLRMQRASSVELTKDELVDIRAAQRTHEGAYVRTAIGQFSFALIIIKVFTQEFYAIGALFATYGATVMAVGWWRRLASNRMIFDSPDKELPGGERQKMFRTCGDVVLGVTVLSTAAYIAMIALILRDTWES